MVRRAAGTAGGSCFKLHDLAELSSYSAAVDKILVILDQELAAWVAIQVGAIVLGARRCETR